jgi:hypothetical protein
MKCPSLFVPDRGPQLRLRHSEQEGLLEVKEQGVNIPISEERSTLFHGRGRYELLVEQLLKLRLVSTTNHLFARKLQFPGCISEDYIAHFVPGHLPLVSKLSQHDYIQRTFVVH